jgi:hypothetical protein
LIKKVQGLSVLERASLAEVLAGNLKTHLLYATPRTAAAPRVAQPDGPDAVPLLSAANSSGLIKSMRPDLSVTPTIDGLTVRFVLPPLTSAIFSRVDGRATLGQIHEDLQVANPELDWPMFKAQFDQFYRILNGLNAMHILYPKPHG